MTATVENLLKAACALSEAMGVAPRPRYSGFLMRQVPDVWGVEYCAGGAGYLINRQALRSCKAVATCGSGKQDLPYEDVGWATASTPVASRPSGWKALTPTRRRR